MQPLTTSPPHVCAYGHAKGARKAHTSGSRVLQPSRDAVLLGTQCAAHRAQALAAANLEAIAGNGAMLHTQGRQTLLQHSGLPIMVHLCVMR